MTSRTVAAACAVVVSAFAVTYLAPMTAGRGAEMDEGALVAYPALVLDGAVPHRDFLTFYGPANLWIIAGAFTVFGESVGSERTVGMAYGLVIVLSLLLIGIRLAGAAAGVLAGIVAAVLMGNDIIWASATYGALALGLLGIALMAWAATADRKRLQTVGLLFAGLAGGITVLIRFDFALAVVLGAVPLLTLVPARRRWWYVGGLLGGMSPYLFHLALVGQERIARVASDLVASGPGRRLPLPSPSMYPGSILALSGLVLLLFLAVGTVLWRRRQHTPVPQILVALALFDLAILPYALSRADAGHIRSFAIVPLSLLPVLALLGVGLFGSRVRLGRGITVGIVLVTLTAVINFGDFSVDRARELRNVRHAHRGFMDPGQSEARAILARARALARPGETLFVGPQDLRRTNYGPTFMYFELRDLLRPASYYLEMNPGTANREGSGLADEVRSADWLILTSVWDDWNEPNDSKEYGPSEPNQVVRSSFCVRFKSDEYRLYERCDRVA